MSKDLQNVSSIDTIEMTDTASDIVAGINKIRLLLDDLRADFFDVVKFDTEEARKEAKFYFNAARTRFEIIDDYADLLKKYADRVDILASDFHQYIQKQKNEVSANA